jgi:flagellar motility protein MotE (MotC chaperone)
VAESIARVARKRRLHDSDQVEELRYWLSRTVEERIEQVTKLRSEVYGFDDATESRLQRVYRRL